MSEATYCQKRRDEQRLTIRTTACCYRMTGDATAIRPKLPARNSCLGPAAGQQSAQSRLEFTLGAQALRRNGAGR
jgi:hypothetical protein